MEQIDIIEELLEALEGTSNMMRGMLLDPSIGHEAKEALSDKMKELDELVDEYA